MRVVRACVCGSDLHPYHSMRNSAPVRAGGVISRVGAPQYEAAPVGFGSLFGRNITLTGGPGAQQSYIEELLPGVLDGRLEPGRVVDRSVGVEETPEGYRAMDSREALKVLVVP